MLSVFFIFWGFQKDFIYYRRITDITDSPVEFGLIPHDDWYQPVSIDEERASKAREEMVAANIIYGGSVPSVLGFPIISCYHSFWKIT